MIGRAVVAGLAATRLVRAWKYEAIGEFPRAALLDWLNKPVMTKPAVAGMSRGTDQVDVRRTAVKEWAAELFDCPHCFGTWIAVGCALGLGNRRLRPVVQGLAGAMVLSIIVQWMPGFDFDESYPAVRVRVMGDETAEAREP